MHFLDRFFPPLLGEAFVAPMIELPEMQPILVDRGQLTAQSLVQVFDDLGIALHEPLLPKNRILQIIIILNRKTRSPSSPKRSRFEENQAAG
jgi:hypothetical protein